MGCMFVMEFYSIMNLQEEVKHLYKKITRGLSYISQGLQECLFMGNINALRDWGHARDYVKMQWLMLQQDTPEDFVIATGIQYSVRDFTKTAEKLDLKLILRERVSQRLGL